MSGIELIPVDGGDAIEITFNKTTIGRGPFLQVADKRVSRNHATLEVDKDGKLVLTPIHANPCFLSSNDSDEPVTMTKDVPKVLKDGDKFGLLPDQLFYEVVYVNLHTKENNKKSVAKEEDTSDTDVDEDVQNTSSSTNQKPGIKDTSGDAANGKPDRKPAPATTNHAQLTVKAGKKEMALPIEKDRKLPGWMAGAGKRTAIGAATSASTTKTPTKPRIAPNARPKATTTPRGGKGGGTPKGRGKRRKREISDEEDEDEEEPARPVRRPRAASLKSPKYKDDLALMIGDDVDLAGLSSDEAPPRRGRGGRAASEDSDFQASGSASGSDWGTTRGSKGKSKARGSPRRARAGAGAGARATRGRRRQPSDSEEDEDLEEEGYVPRPSRRRAAAPKRKAESEDEEEEVRPTRKRKPVVKDDSDEEDDVKAKKKDRRRRCRYGKKCYRKNPVHRQEFSHPGDQSYDEREEEEEEEEGESEPEDRPKPKRKLRQKDLKSVLHGDSDDDGDPNTYDYGDSFLDDHVASNEDDGSSFYDPGDSDSDYNPGGDDEEDVRSLKEEAKGFIRNRKLARPACAK